MQLQRQTSVRPGCSKRFAPFRSVLRLRCDASASTAPANKQELLKGLDETCVALKKAPPSMKMEFSKDVTAAFEDLKAGGAASKWGAEITETLVRRNVFQNELRQVGIKNPDTLSTPSVRNDAAFLITVVLSSSVVATLAGVFLPGDWGFFTSYLIGGISIAVLAIGSINPGILQFFIDSFSLVFPDYKERVVLHEAAHFLIGYLLGVPVAGYSILIGSEHTEFAEAKLQKRIIEKLLTDEEIDQLAVVAVAGMAAEGQKFEEVLGQTADLQDLQRILLRSQSKLSAGQQQNITRWAVYTAGQMLRKYKAEHEALQAALDRGASISECIEAIENASSA